MLFWSLPVVVSASLLYVTLYVLAAIGLRSPHAAAPCGSRSRCSSFRPPFTSWCSCSGAIAFLTGIRFFFSTAPSESRDLVPRRDGQAGSRAGNSRFTRSKRPSRLSRRAGLLSFSSRLPCAWPRSSLRELGNIRFGDARAYLSVADSLARTGHYPRQTDYFSFRAPGYPIFLLAATLGHPERIAAAKAANALLGALSALLLSALAARIFRAPRRGGRRRARRGARSGLVWMTTDIQSEPLFILLILSAGFLLLVAVRPARPRTLAVLSGAFLALRRPHSAVRADPCSSPRSRRSAIAAIRLRARGHLTASALLGFLLGLGPWTIRNALVYHEFVPVNDFAGINLYIGNSDLMDRFYSVRTRPNTTPGSETSTGSRGTGSPSFKGAERCRRRGGRVRSCA